MYLCLTIFHTKAPRNAEPFENGFKSWPFWKRFVFNRLRLLYGQVETEAFENIDSLSPAKLVNWESLSRRIAFIKKGFFVLRRAWNKEEKITLTMRRQCGTANHDQLRSCLIIKNFVNDLIVGAVDELGDMPYYAEHCAAMLAVTYSSGQGMQRNIVSV